MARIVTVKKVKNAFYYTLYDGICLKFCKRKMWNRVKTKRSTNRRPSGSKRGTGAPCLSFLSQAQYP